MSTLNIQLSSLVSESNTLSLYDKEFLLMNKLLLCSLICVSLTATAQQNGPFDIDRHLQQKMEELKQAGKSYPEIGLRYNTLPSLNHYFSGISNNYTLPNGDKITTLPFSNMPCVVPDMKQFQAMPNAANISVLPRQGSPGSIPNAVDSTLNPYIVVRPGY